MSQGPAQFRVSCWELEGTLRFRGQKFDQLTRGMLSDFASQGLSGGAWDFQVDWGPILQQETQKLARKRRHKRVISEVKKVRRSE